MSTERSVVRAMGVWGRSPHAGVAAAVCVYVRSMCMCLCCCLLVNIVVWFVVVAYLDAVEPFRKPAGFRQEKTVTGALLATKTDLRNSITTRSGEYGMY